MHKGLLPSKPFNSQDLISNSPYCLPYSSCDVGLKNLLLAQLIIIWLIFLFILITFLLVIVLILQGEILSWSLIGVEGLCKYNIDFIAWLWQLASAILCCSLLADDFFLQLKKNLMRYKRREVILMQIKIQQSSLTLRFLLFHPFISFGSVKLSFCALIFLENTRTYFLIAYQYASNKHDETFKLA